MYDNSGETDKAVLLQAALLLSFWHSERDSHSQPWYWSGKWASGMRIDHAKPSSGVAISWCQIIGLHRDPDAARVNPLVSPQRRHLWRRLWACCIFRDRWLSLTLGRPLRVRLSDCDMPFPKLHDVTVDLEMLPSELCAYLPHDFVIMVQHWVLLIALSKVLGEVLFQFYQQLGKQPALTQYEDLEAQLNAFVIPELQGVAPSALSTFRFYHLQLHLQ